MSSRRYPIHYTFEVEPGVNPNVASDFKGAFYHKLFAAAYEFSIALRCMVVSCNSILYWVYCWTRQDIRTRSKGLTNDCRDIAILHQYIRSLECFRLIKIFNEQNGFHCTANPVVAVIMSVGISDNNNFSIIKYLVLFHPVKPGRKHIQNTSRRDH